MYARRKNVTGFVTRLVKRYATVLSALFIGIALTFGCGGASQGMELGNELFQGIEQELEQPIRAVKGDAFNHTKHFIVFGIFRPTNFPTDPVFRAELKPGERVFFTLLPGKYIMAAMIFERHSFGNVLKEIKYPFEIYPDYSHEFGFDFHERPKGRQA